MRSASRILAAFGVLVLNEGLLPVHIIGILVIFVGLVFIDGRLVKRLRPAAA